jgi:hypothetical protein
MANPVPAPLNTGSIIANPNGADRTGLALSTWIIIKVAGNAVGAVQTLTVNEQRTITPMSELGTDGIVDSAPTASSQFSGSIDRIRYDLLRIGPALSRDFLHISSQRLPFDIQIFDNWAGTGSSSIVTTVENVWFKSIEYSYRAENWLIHDNVQWQAERISSTLNGGLAATSGARGFPLQVDAIEETADQGLLIGSLSIGGVINELFQ